MTPVDFSRQLSELTNAAAALNRESDSVNQLIERFEETLRKINLGLEAWSNEAVESIPWREEDQNTGDTLATGTNDAQLGFAKYGDKWQLVLRRVTWKRTGGGWEEQDVTRPSRRLLEATREQRIGALKVFPALLVEMKQAADEALKAIREAKKFVDASAPEAEGEAFLRDTLARELEELALPARTINALRNAALHLVLDLVQKNEADLEQVKGLDKKSIDEIKIALAALRLSLDMRIDSSVLRMMRVVK